MHTDVRRVRNRLDRFVAERLRPAIYPETAPLALERWAVPGEPVRFADAVTRPFEPFGVGQHWGKAWSTHWLHVTGTVPEDWEVGDPAARRQTEIVVDLGFNGYAPGFQAEALCFRPDGTIVKGVSPLNAHLPVEGREIDLYLELAANPTIPPESHWRTTALGDRETAGDAELYTLRRLELARRDLPAWELLQDVEVLWGLAEQLPADAPRAAQLWTALDRMLDVVDPDDVAGSADRARAALAPALAAPAVQSAHTIVASGHAHIDSAWLWPVRETVRKCARTFSNVVALMDEDPEFRFACSSAQQLAWVKETYPDLFARIKEKVASGQFVLVGGQWVEPDTNMPGGEATARQLVVGKRFFLEEFGVETREVWLPDTFGYSAALPQLIRLSGSDWFMTQKISWNQTNAMPHHTFLWAGIDGTRVFTHFPPIDTYNARLAPSELAHAQRTYRDHGAGTVSLAPFGWGDGGGGPTREMLAAAHRQADLEGSPRVRLGSPADFYQAAVAENPDLPVWTGEMYLELHRGTLTSQLRTKQGNRRSEQLLHEAELWATTAALRTGADYPYDDLERIWRRVLLLQFHDILPGSSIAWVHREAEADHASIAAELESLIETALEALCGQGGTPLVVNSAPVAIDGIPPLAVGMPRDVDDRATVTETADGWRLANGMLSLDVDRRGLIVSLRDASGRDAIAPGAAANLLRLHRDLPDEWDAWDIDRHYRNHAVDLVDVDEIAVGVEDGAAVVRCTRSFGGSTAVQTISLEPGRAAVDLAVELDWQERHRLLKLVFPLDVHAEHSTAEIQFGHVHRPTHTNTSWDEAKFEFAAQRWIHVGEPGYGVAVANDSTHGHSVERETREGGGVTTTVGLSVVRAPGFPDPHADEGRHVLRFAIRPGAGLREAGEEGRRLSPSARRRAGARGVEALVVSSDPDVLVETVKLAEDRSGDVVVRLYEASGGRRTTTLRTAFPPAGVAVTDLLERPFAEQERVDGQAPTELTLTLRPFEVVTLRYAAAAG